MKNAGRSLSLFVLVCCLNVSAGSNPILVYKLALTTTGEFGAQFDNLAQQSKVVDELVARANEALMRDVGIMLELIPNNDTLLHTDPSTDPFTDEADRVTLFEEGDAFIQSILLPSEYNLSHTISYDSGGFASSGSPCSSDDKPTGVSGGVYPSIVGGEVLLDEDAVNLFLHEIGHQLGANHTFNSVFGVCEFQRSASTAVEPGSGSSIMSYAGQCGPDSFARFSDTLVNQYFHVVSIAEIISFQSLIDTSCVSTLVGELDVTEVQLQHSSTVPASTPLLLEAVASIDDRETNDLVFSWEQVDAGTGIPLTDPDDGRNPLFRSLPPSAERYRYLPQFKDIISGESRPEEKLPTTNRTITMQVSARDASGLVSVDQQLFDVDASTGPMIVSTPVDGELAVDTVKVTWNVANTASELFGAEQVDIFLILNGGTPSDLVTPLLLRTPNDGSEIVTLPPIQNNKAQIIVKAADNVFFNVSPGTFMINGVGNEICPASNVVEHKNVDWEDGTLEDWVAEAVTGDVNWEILQRNADSGSFHVGVKNTATQDIINFPRVPYTSDKLIDTRLTMRSDMLIPENVVLEIRHAKNSIDWQSAGLIEISTNAGKSWQSIESLVRASYGGYDSSASVGVRNALTPEILATSSKPAFSLTGQAIDAVYTTDYQISRYDFSSLAGRSVRLRFRYISNGVGGQSPSNSVYGWDVDTIKLLACVSEPRIFTPSLTTVSFQEGFITEWADNGTSVGSWELLVGTSQGNDDVMSWMPKSIKERTALVRGPFSSTATEAHFTLRYIDLVDGMAKEQKWMETVSPAVIIPDNQWVQIGVPAVPVDVSVATFFADYLNADMYGITWQMFEYVQGASESGYRVPEFDEILAPGKGYWFIQATGDSIVVSGEARMPSVVNTASLDCPDNTPCLSQNFPIVDTTDTYWLMIANPYEIAVPVDNLFIGVELNGQREIVPINMQPTGFIHTEGLFSYTNSEGYDLLGPDRMLEPMQGGWIGVNVEESIDSARRFFAGFSTD